MKASRSLKLIILSSTIKTLIGGTAPSSRDGGSVVLTPALGDLTVAVPSVGVSFLWRRGRAGFSVLWTCEAGVGGVLPG
jgi:hypothetical protein